MQQRLWDLFRTFLKIGAFTFGGGYAMIPLVQNEIVDKKGYITDEEFIKLIAIAEATPGVIAVNTATFVGYRTAGIWGGLLSTLGVILPSFVIITIISMFYDSFRNIIWVDWAFSGIRAGIMVLIAGALVRIIKKSELSFFWTILIIVAFCVASFTEINVIWIILCGAAAGIVRQMIIGNKEEHKDEHLS